ncbi:MAG: hypothetical protein IJQ43_00345 [Oscillospiraceae bacterium]|nr:hypothetical protein [Oscillospiraceae bacterium]
MDTHDICILSVKADEAVARRLGESIRSYRLPSNVKLPEEGLDYRRILYDCEGGPLDDARREALDASRFLVMICTPATRNDPGILARLAYFRRKRRKEDVIAVIAAGEPADSFPESFIEKKPVQHILPDMTVVERIETIEPVAADLRGDTERRRREVLRYETVRITASVLGLHPDDLEQRQRSRRRRAVLSLLALVGVVCLAAAAIFLRLGLIAKREGDVAAEQTRLSLSIAQRTIEELPASFAGDEQALAYIDEAIANARESLDELGLGELLAAPETGGGA